ncbi:MAG: hypothetical protein CEN89_477 [Candidatus Berkelbacteria bacterium Licking1014_7]|uniref:SpoVT-AbrB domain-containing protein n=1 Tax=Candidatus Berkelbacteria bacterium Licking1014_7 TaxID=2017147 RepID=A0A554LIR4_9BACT|nr:MAG: hypothetical protein CEN89_477 [Candidatus Berkelbacteria bacterium Licking1014_7]
MTQVRVRERGEITIPQKIREKYKIEANDMIYVYPMGDGIYLRTKESIVEKAQEIGEQMLKKAGLTVKDLLKDLDDNEA